MHALRATLPFAVLALSLSACSSVGYGDPSATETLTIGYGSTDLQSLSAEMVDSLTESPALSYIDNPGKDGDKRPVVVFGGIENRTSEHIDTSGISDKIQTQLLKTGKYRFLATTKDSGQNEIEEQIRFQEGRTREDQMRQFGLQLGADVILYGSLRSIDKRKGSSIESGGVRQKDKYYQFTLKCVNIDTAEILWQDEAELRKTERTGIFGRT